jgi:acyl-CoA thioester hydrolase
MPKDPIIELPSHFPFETNIDVRVSDLNYGGHLGHAQFFEIIHEARLRFLATYGQSEKDFYGTGLILSKAIAVFKSQAFYGDTLRISVAVDHLKKSRFSLIYKVEKVQSQKLVALFQTEMTCFDYATEKVTAVPGEFVKR